MEGDADGQALPFGGLADGDEVVGLGPGADGALDDGAARSELGDYGDEAAFGGGGDSAVGGVVAEPDGIGDGGIEVGQMECGDVAGDAVDEEPGAGLPDPVGDGVGGEGVVEAEGAADGEAAVGDVVGVAGGPFFLMIVDEEWADFEGGGLVGFGVGSGVGLGVGDAADGAESNGVDFGGGGAEGRRQTQRIDSRSTGAERRICIRTEYGCGMRITRFEPILLARDGEIGGGMGEFVRLWGGNFEGA